MASTSLPLTLERINCFPPYILNNFAKGVMSLSGVEEFQHSLAVRSAVLKDLAGVYLKEEILGFAWKRRSLYLIRNRMLLESLLRQIKPIRIRISYAFLYIFFLSDFLLLISNFNKKKYFESN